jgi:hypothetical protein
MAKTPAGHGKGSRKADHQTTGAAASPAREAEETGFGGGCVGLARTSVEPKGFRRRSGFPQDDDKAGNVEISSSVLFEERAALNT